MQAVQRAGQDGSYRMTIDNKYSILPTLRRISKLLWPLWLTFVMLKTACVAAPLHSSAKSVDTIFLGVIGGSGVISMGLWVLAGLGSKRERVQALMIFNTVLLIATASVRKHSSPGILSMCFKSQTLVAVVLKITCVVAMQHALRIAKHYLSSSFEDASAFEATALKKALESYIPSVHKMSGLGALVDQVSTVVDAAVVVVRCCVLTMI
jgi:hypothetical protein